MENPKKFWFFFFWSAQSACARRKHGTSAARLKEQSENPIPRAAEKENGGNSCSLKTLFQSKENS